MLRAKLLIPFIVLVAVILFVVMQMQPPRVRLTQAEQGRVIEVVYATGRVRPDTETKVAPEVAGRIISLLADEGDAVRFGQVLGRLDDTQARIQLRGAENRLETARARLRQASAPTDPFVVQQLAAQLRAAQSRLRAAEERVRAAGTRVATARDQARAAQASVEGAKAKARAASSSARAAQNAVDEARERVTAAEADVGQARANLDSARDLYRRRQQLLREGAIAERSVTEARTAMEAAEAALKATQSRVEGAQRAVQTSRANADAAQAQAEDAGAAVETARANASAAQSGVREAESAIPELQRQVEAERQDVEAVRSQLGQARRGGREVDINVARTEVRTQEAAVAQAREDLAKYTIKSPVSGRVTDRPVDPGDYVAVGARLFTVANEQKIYVQADVDEADIGQVRQGAEARFHVDAEPQTTYKGRVARIGRAADRSTKTYPVEIRDLDQTAGLRIGMTADVNIQGRVTPQAVLIPTAALQTEKDRTLVWIVDGENRVRRRTVRVKAKDAATVQVVEGLLPGERVVLNPGGRLQEGRQVRVEG
jgi:HlyD family secretion protein